VFAILALLGALGTLLLKGSRAINFMTVFSALLLILQYFVFVLALSPEDAHLLPDFMKTALDAAGLAQERASFIVNAVAFTSFDYYSEGVVILFSRTLRWLQ
jgi:hypothetical protein